MGFRHIRTDKEKLFRFCHFRKGICHSPGTECDRQTGDRGGVSSTSAVIYVVCSDHRTKEFLHLV
jgi:hypothetical protein